MHVRVIWSPSMAGFVRPSISGFSGTPEEWNRKHPHLTNSHTAVSHYATITLLFLECLGNCPPAPNPAGKLENRLKKHIFCGMEELRLLSSSKLKIQQNELSVVCEAHRLEKFNNVKNSKAMRPMKKTKQTNVLVSLHRLQCPLKLFSIAEIVPIVTESIQKQYIIFIYV